MSINLREIRTAGVIGLGIMGGEFAGHLAESGFPTLGCDLLPERMEALHSRGGHTRPAPRYVADEAEIIITSLPSVDSLEDALFGENGVTAAKRGGLLIVETSARERLERAGIAMLDAPVSGTGSQAKAKDITIFVSGDEEAFRHAEPVLARFLSVIRYVGPFGAGSKIKYVANLLVAIHTLAAAEAIAFAEKAGLDPKEVVQLLKGSGATSKMIEVRGSSMADGSYTSAQMKIDVFQKDLDIIGEFARTAGAPVPLFSAAVPYFTSARSLGMGLYDVGAVVEVLRHMAGLHVPGTVRN
jgi:putative dehydrogenase